MKSDETVALKNYSKNSLYNPYKIKKLQTTLHIQESVDSLSNYDKYSL